MRQLYLQVYNSHRREKKMTQYNFATGMKTNEARVQWSSASKTNYNITACKTAPVPHKKHWRKKHERKYTHVLSSRLSAKGAPKIAIPHCSKLKTDGFFIYLTAPFNKNYLWTWKKLENTVIHHRFWVALRSWLKPYLQWRVK